MTRRILAFSLFIVFASESFAEGLETINAQFLRYSVSQTTKPLSKALKVDFSRNSFARKYRTVISKAFSETSEPNFAGMYVLAAAGCGLNCEIPYLIDFETGKVISAPKKSTRVSGKKDSRLLVYGVQPTDEMKDGEICDGAISPPYLIVFDKGTFVDLGAICSWDSTTSRPVWNHKFTTAKSD